jgi:hypothetical protein
MAQAFRLRRGRGQTRVGRRARGVGAAPRTCTHGGRVAKAVAVVGGRYPLEEIASVIEMSAAGDGVKYVMALND